MAVTAEVLKLTGRGVVWLGVGPASPDLVGLQHAASTSKYCMQAHAGCLNTGYCPEWHVLQKQRLPLRTAAWAEMHASVKRP